MKKKILALLLALALVFTLVACSTTAEEEETTAEETTQAVELVTANVLAINGPTAMGMVELFDNEAYNFTFTSDATEVVSLMSTGAVDIAACPLNIASNLFVKMEGEVQMLAINTLGVLYVVVNTDVVGDLEINSMEDLIGQTVYTAGEGTTVEYILDYIVSENDMEDDMTIEFLSEHSEVSTKLAAGEIGIAILPEPFVSVATAANETIEVSLSLTDEWDAVSDVQLAQGCVIASTAFIEENPEAVEAFLANYETSVDFMNNETESAAPILVEYGVLASEAIVNNATENCNIVFITGEEMMEIAQANLQVYFDAEPTSIGGAMPTEDLYYIG
ncbi:MAG: ABC transporter substrate-binding protein [Clostridia bacterium]